MWRTAEVTGGGALGKQEASVCAQKAISHDTENFSGLEEKCLKCAAVGEQTDGLITCCHMTDSYVMLTVEFGLLQRSEG